MRPGGNASWAPEKKLGNSAALSPQFPPGFLRCLQSTSEADGSASVAMKALPIVARGAQLERRGLKAKSRKSFPHNRLHPKQNAPAAKKTRT
jgi:hypothetical protein